MPKAIISVDDDREGLGRPAVLTLEHAPIIQELAANGASQALICAYLGISEQTLYRALKVENSPLLVALKRGQAEAIKGQLELSHGWAKKNVIGNIHRAKAILGKHDAAWTDAKPGASAGGGVEIKITITRGVEPQVEAIDADYEEVE